uniref:NADH-ubiquinone oxidoreductase chain 3 n=1 Tax=Habropoda radoszkowskii TaxID=597470 RepID=A0A7L8EYV2_9HYME|nr:NADH dehydrogenase subunit 3 [Habropoda radoszkowskii]QOE17522.1 NADH dehydrogenase subunit 3 [Habropoda radoszkowskii]
MNYLMLVLFIIIIGFFIYFLNMFICMVKFRSKEKCIPYECGFDPFFKNHLPVSIPFYLIGLMFLVFDIEVVMLIPFVFFMFYLDSLYIMNMFILFLLVMLLTLFLEWNSKYLDWLF